jgi:tRNA uridine 5-carboxymethylaminomethyl modification enzyme
VSDADWAEYELRQQRAVALEKLLATRRISTQRFAEAAPELAARVGDVSGQTYAQVLKRPEVTIEDLLPALREEAAGDELLQPLFVTAAVTNGESRMPATLRNERKAVETEIKYAGYLDQQRRAIERLRKSEERVIPADFEYRGISGLSREVEEKLTRVRPQTLGQASRIPGITPAALSLLNVHVEMHARGMAATGD